MHLPMMLVLRATILSAVDRLRGGKTENSVVMTPRRTVDVSNQKIVQRLHVLRHVKRLKGNVPKSDSAQRSDVMYVIDRRTDTDPRKNDQSPKTARDLRNDTNLRSDKNQGNACSRKKGNV